MRVWLVPLALMLAALAAFAPRADAAFTTAQCEGSNALGRGASFAQAAHGAWEVNFSNVFCGGSAPDINYDPAGSGAGITGMTLRGGADPRFGGTDDPLTSTQKANINNGTASPGDEGQVHQIPIAVGAVAPLVNWPDSCDATLLPDAARTDAVGTGDDNLTRIRFTKAQFESVWARDTGFDRWDDVFPALQADADCDKPIVRVVRFDNSGTTFAFKDYLHRINGARGWLTTYQSGTNGNREWPGATFGARADCAGANGPGSADDATDQLTSACSSNATNLVTKLNATDGSIGYADIASARAGSPTLAVNPSGVTAPDRYWTQIQNGSGTFTEPTVDANGFKTNGGRGANCTTTQFVSLGSSTLGEWNDATGVNSPTGYGLCTLTYGLAFDDNADAYGNTSVEEARARTVKDYLASVVSDTGQALLFANDYAPLPGGILTIARAGVESIDWNKGAGGGGGGGGGNTPPPDNDGGGDTTPPPPPSNVFSVPRTTISSKSGTAAISVKLPGAGRLELVGSAKSGKRTIKVGRVVLTANRAGTFKLTLKPSKAAKSVLRKKGKLKVTLKLTFTPTGGTARSSSRTIALKLAKQGSGKRR